MQNAIRPGMRVAVFHDPVTKTDLEGSGLVIRRGDGTPGWVDGRELAPWLVMFPIGDVVTRWILNG